MWIGRQEGLEVSRSDQSKIDASCLVDTRYGYRDESTKTKEGKRGKSCSLRVGIEENKFQTPTNAVKPSIPFRKRSMVWNGREVNQNEN
jgi:hypothetical protein